MEDTKFSDLDPVTSVASPDFVAVVQGGVSKRADVSLFGSSKASLTLHSSADDSQPDTFTFENSTIRILDINDVEILGIWTGGQYGSLCIANALPAWLPNTSDNTAIGIGAMLNLPADVQASGSTAVGKNALPDLTTGSESTALGVSAGQGILTGSDNVFVGGFASATEDASNLVLIGDDCLADTGVTDGGIGIGQGVRVTTNNTAVIGKSSVTDIYFGSVSGSAKLHAKGDAIVFPDSDPHVAGAAYWVLGVLTRSAG